MMNIVKKKITKILLVRCFPGNIIRKSTTGVGTATQMVKEKC
jgi:hypothetical protein